MLSGKDLEVSYGNIRALRGVDFSIDQGEIVAIIGANGAGKSTLLKAIAGLVSYSRGTVSFLGRDISNRPAHALVQLGISLVPEGRQVFPRLTVLENLKMGAFLNRDQAAVQETTAKVFSLFPVLRERSSQLAGTLSGGEQQMVAIGRGLMANPRVLLLDEPSMGLAPLYVKTIFQVIKTINQSGTSVVLVEQNARKALAISDRGYVMETGIMALSDTASALLGSERVRRAYLGE